MKTAKEWFETLEEPYRTQAIEITSNEDMLNLEYEGLLYALYGSFTWFETPQGHEYWGKLHEKLSNQ